MSPSSPSANPLAVNPPAAPLPVLPAPGIVASLRKYAKILRISLVERLVYRADFFVSTVFRFLPLITSFLLWEAVFASSGRSDIEGFTRDTTLAFARMIFSGFLDKYPNVKLIAAHGGATLPYLAGRLDRCHEMIPACASVIKERPSEYLKRIWYDTVVYDQRALEMCIAVAGSADRVLYGSDYPHTIGDPIGGLPLDYRAKTT